MPPKANVSSKDGAKDKGGLKPMSATAQSKESKESKDAPKAKISAPSPNVSSKIAPSGGKDKKDVEKSKGGEKDRNRSPSKSELVDKTAMAASSKPSTASGKRGADKDQKSDKKDSGAGKTASKDKGASKPATPPTGKRAASPASSVRSDKSAAGSVNKPSSANPASTTDNADGKPSSANTSPSRRRQKNVVPVVEEKPKLEKSGKYGVIEVWTKVPIIPDTLVEFFAVMTPEFSVKNHKYEWLVVDFETHKESKNKEWKGFRRVYRRHDKPYYYNVPSKLDLATIDDDDKTWGLAKSIIRPLCPVLVQPI